jgi:hypothetical protein
MGQDLEQPRKFAARRLKCDDPRVRNKYIAHYEKYIENKQLRQKSRKLVAYVNELGLTQKQAREYEQLDGLRKKESTKHIHSAGNSGQEKKTGHKKPQYWEPEYSSGS